MISSGELNTKIIFQSKSDIFNEYNEPEENWVDTCTRWAAVKIAGGREFWAAQRLNAETSAVFKIRYSAHINLKCG